MKDIWIRNTWEYQRIYREGIKETGKRMIIYSCQHEGDTARFGIAVTSRIGKAVVRNRIKRILREIIRKNVNNLHGGFDTAVVARGKILLSPFQEIEKELLNLLKKAERKKEINATHHERQNKKKAEHDFF